MKKFYIKKYIDDYYLVRDVTNNKFSSVIDGTEGINLRPALQVDFDKKEVFINDEVDIRGNDFLLLDSVCRSGKKFSISENDTLYNVDKVLLNRTIATIRLQLTLLQLLYRS